MYDVEEGYKYILREIGEKNNLKAKNKVKGHS